METSIFEKYFTSVFLPSIGNERPVLLVYDGHSTHVDLKVIEIAASENITILKLPPHTSHILQPLDCSAMKPMKDRWEDALVKWQRLHVGAKLPKYEFSRILTEIWDDLNPVILANGFRKTGIYPVNRQVIPKEKFDPITWSNWEKYVEDRKQMNCVDNDKNDSDEKTLHEHTTPVLIVEQSSVTVPTLLTLAIMVLNNQKTQTRDNNLQEINSKDMIEEHKMTAMIKKSYERRTQHTAKKIDITIEQSANRKVTKKDGTLLDISNKIKVESKKLRPHQRQKKDKKETFKDLTDKNEQNSETELRECCQLITYPPKIKNNLTSKLSIPRGKFTNTSSNKIEILENLLVKPAQQTNKQNELDNMNIRVPFEQLLLKSIARNDPPKTKKKRVRGAEVLTYKEVVDRIKNEQKERKKKIQKPAKKVLLNKNKKIKKKHYVSDSNSSCSYQSANSSLNEDPGIFFDNLLADESIRESLDENFETTFNSEILEDTFHEMPTTSTETVATPHELSITLKEACMQHSFAEEANGQTILKEGDFVLAKFSSARGKKTYKYVCLIHNVSDDKIVVKGLKSYKQKDTFRIIEDDISIIDSTDVIANLPQPECLDGVLYKFQNKIEVVEL